MTAPERIWAWQWQTVPMGQWGITASPSSVEYVRADLHDATKVQLEKAHEKEVAVWSENYAALERKLAKAVEALRECQAEIDQYIRQEYPLDHPVHERYRQRDMSANPARAALAEIEKGGV